MSQTLYLLRHAKAEPWSPGINDFERALAQRGHDHMQHLSEWAREKLPAPESALCSSSLRTRETLLPLLGIWPRLSKGTAYLDEIYEASAGSLHALAGQAFHSSESILMVGHNPGFEQFLLGVLHDLDTAKITKMASGVLAVIEFPNGYDHDCGQGLLRHWVKRKDLSVRAC